MRVAHIGPPLARQGGPSGYLLQLRHAAQRAGAADEVCFPPAAARQAPADPGLPGLSGPAGPRQSALRRAVSALRRTLSPPRFYRPDAAALRAEFGHVEAMMSATKADQVADARASFDTECAQSAAVLFCHDAAVAEHALERRRAGQAVWLMVHAPMPLALYLTWSWGVPEWDWREVASLADVRRWSNWEAAIWRSVDRLIVPCREAFGELVRIEPDFAPLMDRLTCVLSGASLQDERPPVERAEARLRFGLPIDQRIGLFLGNQQPYRGLDALAASVRSMDGRMPDGIVAIAGPPRTAIRPSRRLHSLGPVSDVPALLRAVDFVINVNRFSLFDLSTIEALEAAKPVLMHAVGGNVTFQELGAGCVMVPDLDPATIAGGLSRMFAMSADEREALGQNSRRCYERHLTLASFWRRHADLYAQAPASRPTVTA